MDKTGLDKDQKALVNQIESKFSTIARLGRVGSHYRIKRVLFEKFLDYTSTL